MSLVDRILRRGAGPEVGAATRARFDRFVAQARATRFSDGYSGLAATDEILAAPPEEQLETLRLALSYVYDHRGVLKQNFGGWSFDSPDFAMEARLAELAGRLLKRRLPCSEADLCEMLDSAVRVPHQLPVGAVLRAIERQLDGAKPDGPLRNALERASRKLFAAQGADQQRRANRALALLASDAPEGVGIEPVDAWTRRVLAAFEAEPGLDHAVAPLLTHAASARSSKPSARWTREAEKRIGALGPERHRDLLATLLDAVGTASPEPVKAATSFRLLPWQNGDPSLVSDRYSDLLRGLIWSAGAGRGDELATRLGDAAERCFQKLPGHGPRAPKIGNACLHVLGALSSRDAVAQLTRLKTRVKHPSSRRQVEKALEAAAAKTGMSAAELEEVGVPSAGLTQLGRREQAVGEFTALLQLRAGSAPELSWKKPDGKPQKSVPAVVKAEHPEALAELRRTSAELKKLVPAQAARLEQQLAAPHALPYADWRERYADHVLVGFLARRLVWWLGAGDDAVLACFDGDTLVDLAGDPVAHTADAPVRLWHPIESEAATVGAWRDALAEREITQPFKQAHREIYVLTDAERDTDVYSNRFAAHVLRQHVFHALCRERGWSYDLQGQWDSHNVPHRTLPGGWRQEFWVEPATGLETETSASYVYLYLASDQVRFYRTQHEPTPLSEVPPLLFSEGMRDVDLFVGVASVASDPTWEDGGPEGRYAGYWADHAFGDLNASAKTRRDALARMLPKLKIADRCELEERSLRVRGDLRSYHIHLGSANIRMSPNDQYLCIVPGRRANAPPANVVLPFEGDRVLSIILSKAFLLAEDSKIKDPAIRSQIR